MKVCFLSWHFATPKIFLDSLLKMTPGCSGKWKDMEAVLDPFQADFCIIMDGYNGPFPEDRTIYVGAHPYVEGFSPAFRKWEEKKALLKLHLEDNINPGEWWIGYTYDYLSALRSPIKTRDLACCMTYQMHNAMYAQRVLFMRELAKSGQLFWLYGRPSEKFENDEDLKRHYCGCLGHNKPDGRLGEHLTGKESLIDYTYTLEYDVGPTRNYFSERFYDSLLMWCMPLYFGSSNIHEFIPAESFEYVDIYNYQEIHKIKQIVKEGKRNILAIAEARDLLLNKYQLWPYIYDRIKQL